MVTTQIELLADRQDPDFLRFWAARHPLPLEEAGLDWQDHHAIYVEREDGEIVSACVLVAFCPGGRLVGHNAYLASRWRNKRLIRFCREAMEAAKEHPDIRLVAVETRQMKTLIGIDKLAKYLGFRPVRWPGMAYTDYLWNAKGGPICHQ